MSLAGLATANEGGFDETTSLKTALGASALLALIGGAVFLAAPASAGEDQSYVGDGAPATLQ
jgi:hypothetical protein